MCSVVKIPRSVSVRARRSTKKAPSESPAFNAQVFLDSAGVARTIKKLKGTEAVYSQGDAATSILYLQEGGVKLTVVNGVGKEAIVAILEPGDFFGEGCLAGQSVRMGTATAITPSTVLDIEKTEMFKVLHEQHALSDRFITFMLSRNVRIEEDLIERETAGANTVAVSEVRQRGSAARTLAEDIARDAGRDDWNNAFAREFFHE